MKEIIALSRWKEHVPYTVPLTVLGALIARSTGSTLDGRLLFILLANIVTVSYAFMINDIEDAEDDAYDHKKKKRNPISAGKISKNDAYLYVRILAAVALFFYASTNSITFSIGIVTLLLSHLYSWKKVRLKAYPIADIVSHSLMLSGLLLLTGFTSFSVEFKEVWLVTGAAVLLSVYGQFYNQIRDFDVDVKAKLKNTTILVGKDKANILKNASILFAVIALITSIYFKTFPSWLILPAFLTLPTFFVGKHEMDSSGNVAIDLSGRLQLQMILVFNVIVLAWLVQTIFMNFV